MKIVEESDLPAQINIVPMIDVIFAVLAFLIVSSLFLTRLEGLPVALPEAGTATPAPQAPVVVTIEANGAIALNQAPIALENLAAAVAALPSRGPTPTLVVLNADAQVSHGIVVTVMDELRALEQIQLAIATRPPDSEPSAE